MDNTPTNSSATPTNGIQQSAAPSPTAGLSDSFDASATTPPPVPNEPFAASPVSKSGNPFHLGDALHASYAKLKNIADKIQSTVKPGAKRELGSLNDKEMIALAISTEEDNTRINLAYAAGLTERYPVVAEVFERLAHIGNEQRQQLISLFKRRFGETIPLIRTEHVLGYYKGVPDWLSSNLSIRKTLIHSNAMQQQSQVFYRAAAAQTLDADTRSLFGDLATANAQTHEFSTQLQSALDADGVQADERVEKKQFLLTYVQPGLAGLMDGSISTLAPIFATAFATGNSWTTFLVGLSASLGAGISMGFTEAVHDDGVLSGRGSPLKRGLSCGIMTTIGGLGHTLPYLIADFKVATGIAIAIVFLELWAITWIQNRYMETPWSRATIQVVVGGALVFLAGIFIGSM